jgi:hypothetical protein
LFVSRSRAKQFLATATQAVILAKKLIFYTLR